jgi:hypothetical protein
VRSASIFDIEPAFHFEEIGASMSCTRYIKLPNINRTTIYEVMAEVQQLQEFIIDNPNSVATVANYRMFLDVRCFIQQTLLFLKRHCTGVEACLRYALILYVYRVFRSVVPLPFVWIMIAKRLRACLQQMDGRAFTGRESMLLWILFIGGTPLKEPSPPLRKWYVGAVAALCCTLNLTTWDSVVKELGLIIRPPKWLEQEMMQFWTEVEAAKGSPVEDAEPS